jgi:tetratricopeptide (TPR) repeat protein
VAEKNLGNEAYKKKDFATAHQHYAKAIELDPTNITFYSNNAGKLLMLLLIYMLIFSMLLRGGQVR